jgi:hypothetical protein
MSRTKKRGGARETRVPELFGEEEVRERREYLNFLGRKRCEREREKGGKTPTATMKEVVINCNG